MDPEAVLDAARRAVERARAGGGPDAAGVPDLPLRRPPHLGAHGPPALPRPTRRWRAGGARDPVGIQGARLAAGARAAIDAEIEALLDEARAVRAGEPGTRTRPARCDYLYAERPAPAAGRRRRSS